MEAAAQDVASTRPHPPISACHVFGDAERYAATVRNTQAVMLPVRSGSFRARLTLVTLPRIMMQYGEESAARVVRVEIPGDRIFFSPCQPGDAPMIIDGEDRRPGDVRVLRRGDRSHQRSLGGATWRVVSLRPEDLEAGCIAALGTSGLRMLADSRRLRPDPLSFARLARLQNAAFHAARRAAGAPLDAGQAAALDSLLTDAVVQLFADPAMERDRAAQGRGSTIMARAEHFIAENEDRPIGLVELCAAAGCSAKTLETLFLDRTGVPPNLYMRLRRLRLAHRSLSNAAPRTTTVSAVAASCGFWEFGRFACFYRSVFGESPSETLLRAPDGAKRPDGPAPIDATSV